MHVSQQIINVEDKQKVCFIFDKFHVLMNVYHILDVPKRLYVKNIKTKKKADGLELQTLQTFTIHKRTARVLWTDLDEIGYEQFARIETQYGFSPDRTPMVFVYTADGVFRGVIDKQFVLSAKKPKAWGYKIGGMFLNFKRTREGFYITMPQLDKLLSGLKSCSSWTKV